MSQQSQKNGAFSTHQRYGNTPRQSPIEPVAPSPQSPAVIAWYLPEEGTSELPLCACPPPSQPPPTQGRLMDQ